jgi:hypothetical protein
VVVMDKSVKDMKELRFGYLVLDETIKSGLW